MIGMANFIINTTAARNNGDVALITALSSALEARGHRVTYATQHRKYMHDVQGITNTCREVFGYSNRFFQRRYFADLSALACLLFSRTYRAADVIVGAPGGYVNSYYGFNWRRAIYRWAHRLGKKTAIYAQSIGPLNAKDRNGLKDLSKSLNVLMTRDDISTEAAISASFPKQRIISSVDAIFLSPPKTSERSRDSKTVAISVREWGYDGRDIANYSQMVVKLAELTLSLGFEIEFISTCQGIPDYIDDSELASSIAERIRRNLGPHAGIKVNRTAMGVDELASRLCSYRFVIGTRLHMCLLALLAGIPAFNISYESKGKECYRYLGFDEYSIDYNAETDFALDRLSGFINSEREIRDRLPMILSTQHQRATADLDAFLLGIDVN